MSRSPIQRVGDQFGAPTGRSAAVVAVVLNLVNRSINRAAVAAVDAQPGERAVDLGFGGGLGLRALAARVGPDGGAIGVERSSELVGRARRRGLTAEQGTAEATGLAAESVDALISVNTVYFWPDIDAGFREIARVLAPGGRVAIGVHAKILHEHTRAGRSALQSIDDVQTAMAAAGLQGVEARPAGGAVILVGRRSG